MSNQVYGYALLNDEADEASFREAAWAAASKVGLGLTFIGDDELFNFPKSRVPRTPHVSFRISDGPEKNTASYLVDFENYAPGSDIGLPLNGTERLQLLLSMVSDMGGWAGVAELDVAVTDCEEIAGIEAVALSFFSCRLHADMEQNAPPNKLYVLRAVV